MNSFTDIYLQGLRSGMVKIALSRSDIANFKPFDWRNSAITGSVIGAGAGALAGGLGNMIAGSPREERDGRRSNGLFARGLKGALVGGLLGIGAGYAGRHFIGGKLNKVVGDKIMDKIPGKGWIPDSIRGQGASFARENLTLRDIKNYVLGGGDATLRGRGIDPSIFK